MLLLFLFTVCVNSDIMLRQKTHVIEDLLNKPLGCYTFNETSDIKNGGRPVPAIPNMKFLHKEKGREYFHYFNVHQYESLIN